MTGLAIWWHRRRGHTVDTRRVSVPLFDGWAKGLLHDCSCGKGWAQ